MTGPAVRPDDTSVSLPPLHRILSPDEFQQAQQMSPAALSANPFPVVPPAAPKDAVAQISSQTPRGAGPTTGTPLMGKAKDASDAFQGMADHPITTALTALTLSNPASGWLATGLMGRELASYAGQKAAEETLPKDVQGEVAANPEPDRITGHQAALDAALLAVPVIGGKALRVFSQSDSPAAVAIRAQMADVSDAWRKITSPASRSPDAAQAAGILRATTGEAAAQYEQAAFKLDEFRRAINPLPDAEKLNFIDAIEGGRSQVNPDFQAPADAIRATLDDAREQIQALGTGKLEHFIKDYFPHIWTDPERAATAFEPQQGPAVSVSAPSDAEAAKIAAGGKRPMEGSKAFLKQRSIPTTMEGIQAGLTPVSTNPVDLTLLKLREMQRYLMAHQSLNALKDADLVKFVRSGDQAPDGYAKIDDKIATVFGPRQGAVNLPDGANVDPNDVGVYGMRIMGEHWAPEPVARVVNNYLSPGLRGNAIYDAYKGLGNTLNQAQLGLSAFHLGFTSMDASVSRAALGLEYISSGQPVEGLKQLASAPIAPVTNAMKGAKIRAAYLNPDAASPDMLALANAVKEAGGRVRQDSFYQNSAPAKMIEAWKAGEYGKATALSLPALFETAARPIMEHIVPMQKLGIFGDMAQKALAELPDDASLVDRRAALGKAWDSVDNRMGQVVYDNLFWNKTFKDLAMGSVRSVGWNLGTIRELGGGVGDLAGMAKDAMQDNPTALTHRAAYVMALPITVGLYGAMYQYLRTGQGPSELKDYYFPKTGEVDADGNPERIQLPSYMKDMVAYAGSPFQTLKHKEAPLLSSMYEMLNNQDYFGDEIRNPNDPAVQQLGQEAEYIGKTVLPFSVTNMMEDTKRGDQSAGTKFGNWFGVTPAPRDKVRSTAQNMIADMQEHDTGVTPEDAAARQSRSEILSALRGGNQNGDVDQAVTDAIERHQLTSGDVVKLLKRAGTTPAAEKFKRLTLPQAMQVFKVSTDAEKAKFAEALVGKLERAGDSPSASTP